MNGYQIIDLKDTTLSGSGTKVSGVFESIKNSNRKPLLLTGIVIDGTEMNSVFVSATTTSGNYVISAYGKTITVKPDDTITEA